MGAKNLIEGAIESAGASLFSYTFILYGYFRDQAGIRFLESSSSVYNSDTM